MQTRDPRIRRYPCAWCEQPAMWPDACAEGPEASDRRCARIIERQCMTGDHRRCAVHACTYAARWHQEVRQVGVDAARTAGKLWAVVSTIEHRVDVVGTETNLGRARTLLVNALWRAGRLADPIGLGQVYVVRATDGGFL